MTKQSGYLIKMKAFLPSGKDSAAHVGAHETFRQLKATFASLGISIEDWDDEFKPYGITRSAPPEGADAAAGDGEVHPSAVPAAAAASEDKRLTSAPAVIAGTSSEAGDIPAFMDKRKAR